MDGRKGLMDGRQKDSDDGTAACFVLLLGPPEIKWKFKKITTANTNNVLINV